MMKRGWTIPILGAIALLFLAACQTGPFARPTSGEEVFDVPADVAFAEIRALFDDHNYKLQVVQPAAGRLEALSPIRTDRHIDEAAQRRIRISVTEEAPEQVRVTIIGSLLEETYLPRHGPMTFERPLSEAYYEAFFDELRERLDD